MPDAELPALAITTDMTRHAQKDVQRAYQAQIDQHISAAKAKAAESYEKGVNAKSEVLAEVEVTRKIFALYKKNVYDYLLTDSDDSHKGNTDRGIRTEENNNCPTKKTMRGEEDCRYD